MTGRSGRTALAPAIKIAIYALIVLNAMCSTACVRTNTGINSLACYYHQTNDNNIHVFVGVWKR